MLNKVRAVAKSTIFKFILLIIVLAFIISIANNTIFRPNQDRVKFTKAKNISEIELIQEKKILSLQMQQNPISDVQLEQMALRTLISQHLFKQLANEYDIVISDDVILDNLYNSQLFLDNNQNFDSNIFQNMLQALNISERQYFAREKNHLAVNTILNSFNNNCYIPSIVVNDMINTLTQIRVLQIVNIDLLNQKLHGHLPAPTQEQLKEFYNNHQDMFTEPEKRNIRYIILDSSYFTNQVKFNKDILKEFYDTHRDQMTDIEDFTKDIEQIKKQYISQQVAAIMQSTMAALEDQVASGSTLTEIANSVNVNLSTINGITKDELSSHSLLSSFAENIFDLQEHEVSYPLEIENEKLILVDIDKVIDSKLSDFQNIYKVVLSEWYKYNTKEFNLKLLSDFKQTTTAQEFMKEALQRGFTVQRDVRVSRVNKESWNSIPSGLIPQIIELKEQEISEVYVSADDNKAYLILLSSIVNDTTLDKTLYTKLISNLHGTLQELIVHQLFMHLYQSNQPNVEAIK